MEVLSMNATALEPTVTAEYELPMPHRDEDSSEEQLFDAHGPRWMLSQTLTETRAVRRELREIKEENKETRRDFETRLRILEERSLRPNEDIEELKQWKWKTATLLGLIYAAITAAITAVFKWSIEHKGP